MSKEQRQAPQPFSRNIFKKPFSRKEVKLDSISNLPSDIVLRILAHLPIKDAVRTSILSTRWRYIPAMLQILKFDEQCESMQEYDDEDTTTNCFAHIVGKVLLLHIGNIYEFQVSHRDFSAAADIDRWLLRLSRSSVKILKLVIPEGDYSKYNRYRLPSCFFSCQDLIHMQLHHCLIIPPSTFKGFNNLEHLDIQHVTFASRRVFDSFIVGCPKLKELILKECYGVKNIRIDAPNLQSLAIVDGSTANLFKFSGHLPNIRDLHLLSYSLKYLAVRSLLGKLPKPIRLLNDISMEVDFTNLEEIRTTLCLVRSLF